MAPLGRTSNQRTRYEPVYDINPRTGVSIQVFYARPHPGDVR